MRYIGNIFRPPSEAYSLLVQVTVGCAHNKCTFCSMYKDKQFRLRPLTDVLEDLEDARRRYRRVDRMFLCDGDALCLKNDKLLPILGYIKENFPECERVTSYGRASDILRKSDKELKELLDYGLKMVYLGAESGNKEVLNRIKKGETREEIVLAVKRLESIGIKTSVTFISGISGSELLKEHAIDTASMISEMNASYVSLLTLMLEPGTPLYEDYITHKFVPLTPEEVLLETKLLLENTNPTKSCVFRANHASNYVSLRGNLPEDKELLISVLDRCIKDHGLLKDERFRAL